MAFGIKVLNADSRVILDSREDLATIVKGSTGTVSGNSVNYPSGQGGNLFFMNVPSPGGTVAENQYSGTGSRSIYSSNASAKPWFEGVATSTSSIPGYGSGYGINVFDPTNGTGLNFSSQTADAFEIIAVGKYSDLGSNTSMVFTINSTSQHYVLVPGSIYKSYNVFSFVGTIYMGYKFNYSGSTCTSIEVQKMFTWSTGTVTTSSIEGVTAFMIVKLRGT
tara:strand:+ start:2548 stop:3210 length:663 start_codon:yes stop_codon:yes gene_type:complete